MKDHLACALKKRYITASVTFGNEFKFHLALDISNYMHELVSVANPHSQERQASKRQHNANGIT